MGELKPTDGEAAESEDSVVDSVLLTIDTVATAVFAVVAAAAVLVGGAMVSVLVGLSAVLFLVGSVACLWAFAVAVQRSRESEIGPAQLYFLTGGCAPVSVRNRFALLLTIQAMVGLGAAAIRPFTGVAFGILVPMFGLGLAGLWAARNGVYPERVRPVGPRGPRQTEDRQE